MKERYKRNYPSISEEEQNLITNKTACILGCGGLGGFVIENLARIGIGCLKLVDCDVFSVSNLNRQLLSNEDNIGKSKADEAEKHIHKINSEVRTETVHEFIDSDNIQRILKDCDIVIDALDNIAARLIAEHACAELGIYLVHGAVSGWCMQASSIAPGSKTLEKIYPQNVMIAPPSVLPFIAAYAAGIQTAEAIKILTGKKPELEGKLLVSNLRNMTFTIVNMKKGDNSDE